MLGNHLEKHAWQDEHVHHEFKFNVSSAKKNPAPVLWHFGAACRRLRPACLFHVMAAIWQMRMRSYQSQNMNMSSFSLNASLLIDKIVVMRRSEQSSYLYGSYFKEPPMKSNCTDPGEFSLWREKICHWTYTVIDHFNLSRRTVAISMDLFDRFLATLGNNCDGNQALLISLTTLYISIKIHEKKKIKLSTLSDLSRSQFTPKEIEDMEKCL